MAIIRGAAGAVLAAAAILAAASAWAQEISGVATAKSGNLLFVGEKPVRLFGVTAPESNSACDAGEGEIQCGIIAWAELIKLADGKELSCDPEPVGGDVIYATCYVGEYDINEALVRTGWAEVSEQSDRYRGEQEEARQARRGMWAGRVRPLDRRQAL